MRRDSLRTHSPNRTRRKWFPLRAKPALLAQMAARIADAEFVCVPRMGHLANMEAPEPFNAALIDFLSRRF